MQADKGCEDKVGKTQQGKREDKTHSSHFVICYWTGLFSSQAGKKTQHFQQNFKKIHTHLSFFFFFFHS